MDSSPDSPIEGAQPPRRPKPPSNPGSTRGSQFTQDVQEKMKAFHLSRQSTGSSLHGSQDLFPKFTPSISPHPSLSASPRPRDGPSGGSSPSQTASPGPLSVTNLEGRPIVSPSPMAMSRMNLNPAKGLAAKRGLKMPMKLTDATGPVNGPTSAESDAQTTGSGKACQPSASGSLFNKYAEYVDTDAGVLKFKGKAVVHGKGIDFSEGTSFRISLDEVENLDELGKGNYGTVYKVRHSKPRVRKQGQGLGGNKAHASQVRIADIEVGDSTGVIMAMKEIRLELDEAKFAAIIMELDILHRCISPFIIDFYGAFFQEGAVYICMEFMDGGSVDKLYRGGIPETVLQRITLATVKGLKSLKDEHNIIHRDVKPTNILLNSKGGVKICDFGVSGNLVASIAKTNIGCQSYMAPERISSGGVAQAGANPGGGTYSVQSDIWSLGLTIIECALGQYPYPPETYDNIFSQLSAIVDGDPPDLPTGKFSETARDFVKGALNKIPKLRPTYAMLLRHPWLASLTMPETIEEEDEAEENDADLSSSQVHQEAGLIDAEVAKWVRAALDRKRGAGNATSTKPALHTAPLDAVTKT